MQLGRRMQDGEEARIQIQESQSAPHPPGICAKYAYTRLRGLGLRVKLQTSIINSRSAEPKRQTLEVQHQEKKSAPPPPAIWNEKRIKLKPFWQ